MSQKYVLKHDTSGPPSSIDYKKELNAAQYEVVTGADGPCLVLAGAGSGKTRTLIYRVAYLLEKDVRPEEILLVTFTNKAANEMKNRVESLLKAKSHGLWCGTFHHIGNRILRRYAKYAGIEDNFGILDEEDSNDLLKSCIKALDVKTLESRFPKPRVVHGVLSFAVNARRTIKDVVSSHYPYFSPFVADFEKIDALYREKKKRTNNLDYDDLLVRWIDLLKNSTEVLARLSMQFRYCLVDEYQDTNRLQHEIVNLLSGHHKNLLVVGDDAQSIYSFRAAEIKNILDFPEKHEKTKIFKLETNYRSTKPILELANESIKNNVHQFPKKLKSVCADGPQPQFVQVRDGRQEARFVVQRILELRESGVDLSDMAVLFRAHYQAAELEMELAKRGIPYITRCGARFFEQAHVKDVLAFLKIVHNPLDEIAWARALTLQPGIGGGYADKIFAAAEKEGGDLAKIAAAGFGANFPPKVRDGLTLFKKILSELLAPDLHSHPDILIEKVLDKGYNKYVLLNFENAQDRLEDLRELARFAQTYPNLKDFLADVTLKEGFKGESMAEGQAEEEATDFLILSTIHQAKGLEWNAVFIIRLSDGQFPHLKSAESENGLEEERRLFYVASTRAKERLFLMHPMTRFDYNAGMIINRPSPFILELPKSVYEDVEVEEENDSHEETIYLD